MPRLLGVDIPRDKKSYVSLTYIYGIGVTKAKEILQEANIDINKRAIELTDEDISSITNIIQKGEMKVEGDLRRELSQNVKLMMDIRCYRGLRHMRGLPVNGQRTSTNARTRKGKKPSVGGASKKGK